MRGKLLSLCDEWFKDGLFQILNMLTPRGVFVKKFVHFTNFNYLQFLNIYVYKKNYWKGSNLNIHMLTNLFILYCKHKIYFYQFIKNCIIFDKTKKLSLDKYLTK